MHALTAPDGLRFISSLLCAAAFAGLIHRAVHPGTVVHPVLARLTLVLFALLELIVALGTWRRSELGGPFNEAQWFIMGHAVAVILLCLSWHRLAERRRLPS